MITIVNYKMGNLGSIRNMLKYLGIESFISSDPNEIEKAQKIILPGVGSFDKAISNIKELGLFDVLNKKALKEKTPILGICLGMQLLARNSEEGVLEGLGWVDAEVKKFRFENTSNEKLKIPHMGWNTVETDLNHKLFDDLHNENRFYFVHTYYMTTSVNTSIIGSTKHGHSFTSAVQNDNILGVQFHPEKSHKFGMQLLKNFVNKF